MLGFATSHVGHVEHGQPDRGSSDATVLAHAVQTKQIIVTKNHDMIMLCAERRESVVWIDPYGRQFRHDELAAVAFSGIATWHELLAKSDGPVCVRVLRTKVEVMSLDRASVMAESRMRRIAGRNARQRRGRAEVSGQIATPGEGG